MAHDAEGRNRIMATMREHIAKGEFPEARVRVYRLLYGPPVIWPVSTPCGPASGRWPACAALAGSLA